MVCSGGLRIQEITSVIPGEYAARGRVIHYAWRWWMWH